MSRRPARGGSPWLRRADPDRAAIPRPRRLRHDGVELCWRAAGEGTPVLALHAGIADSRMWRPQFADARGACRIVAPDMPGYGGTPVPVGHFSIQDLLDALLASIGVDGYWLWGVSFGARLALERAIERPAGVRGLVVVSPLLERFAGTPAMTSFVKAEEDFLAAGDIDAATELNLATWLSGPCRNLGSMSPRISRRVRAMQRRAFRAQAAGQPQSAECGFDAGDRAAELDLPVLVVCGSLDHDCVRQSAEHLAARVRGATLWIAEGAAHLPSVELPEQFDRRVLDFMAGRQHR